MKKRRNRLHRSVPGWPAIFAKIFKHYQTSTLDSDGIYIMMDPVLCDPGEH